MRIPHTIDILTAQQGLYVSDDTSIVVEQSLGLSGTVDLIGAKNAVLVIMASLILTHGTSLLTNVPWSDDVFQMIHLLRDLGAHITPDYAANTLEIDTSCIVHHKVQPAIMKKMRASVLVMGPLLARFGRADIALPGGCSLGERPINLHLQGFAKMGVTCIREGEFLTGAVSTLKPATIVFDYPSVGATENIMMAAVMIPGVTKIINAALEPEVLDLIAVLRKMGAKIMISAPATVEIEGVSALSPVRHHIMYDRLEAGALLLAAAITGGSIYLPHASADTLDVVLLKLEEMGHAIERGVDGRGIHLKATKSPQAVSFTTGPYPQFPTDLQAPMMAAQCVAAGKSRIHETVYENRLMHVRELQKMGAQITVEGDCATVVGVDALYGAHVIASDIRASCSLVLAGLAAQGMTTMMGISYWRRAYQALDKKLLHLGARIHLKEATN